MTEFLIEFVQGFLIGYGAASLWLHVLRSRRK